MLKKAKFWGRQIYDLMTMLFVLAVVILLQFFYAARRKKFVDFKDLGG